jgi:hypothetical protein
MIRRLAVLALLCGALGCSTLGDPMGRQDALEDTQLAYTRNVRWGNFDDAGESVEPAERDAFLAHRKTFEKIRITDYEIGKIDYADDLRSATVRVVYRGYAIATLEEREIEETQHWTRPEGSSWFVKPEMASLVGAFPEASH